MNDSTLDWPASVRMTELEAAIGSRKNRGPRTRSCGRWLRRGQPAVKGHCLPRRSCAGFGGEEGKRHSRVWRCPEAAAEGIHSTSVTLRVSPRHHRERPFGSPIPLLAIRHD